MKHTAIKKAKKIKQQKLNAKQKKDDPISINIQINDTNNDPRNSDKWTTRNYSVDSHGLHLKD
jgi:hypothetical protein